ncbi:MAG: hypothetical protein GW795_15600, partial [Cyanobacteria bacterium]|nr:hypothetical protein [Cyanobacteria bacterium CG_2015-04_32_10]
SQNDLNSNIRLNYQSGYRNTETQVIQTDNIGSIQTNIQTDSPINGIDTEQNAQQNVISIPFSGNVIRPVEIGAGKKLITKEIKLNDITDVNKKRHNDYDSPSIINKIDQIVQPGIAATEQI